MDIGKLDSICKSATQDAYFWFKHSINEPLFEVSHSYISQNIEHMKVDIGISVMKKFYKNINSEQQFEIVSQTIGKYKNIAIEYGWRYGMKHIH